MYIDVYSKINVELTAEEIMDLVKAMEVFIKTHDFSNAPIIYQQHCELIQKLKGLVYVKYYPDNLPKITNVEKLQQAVGEL